MIFLMFIICQGPGLLELEAPDFSAHNSNQVMEVSGFLPDYTPAGGEIKNSRERGRLGNSFFFTSFNEYRGTYRSSAPFLLAPAINC